MDMKQRTVRTPRRSHARKPTVRRRTRTGLRLPTAAGLKWRWVSLALALVAAGGLIFLFTSEMFVVSRVEVGGTTYVPAEEIYTLSAIADKHILQVNPEEVAQRVASSPSLEAAEVIVEWPARVIILVQEREPAIVWEQGEWRYWVDSQGRLMPERVEIPSLVRVVNEGEEIPFQCPGPACSEAGEITIDPAVVAGTQHLKTLRSNIEMLYYDPVHGLSYQDGRGWRGYFGVGADMDIKLAVYETLIEDLEARGLVPVYIDVSNPDAPFYRIAR